MDRSRGTFFAVAAGGVVVGLVVGFLVMQVHRQLDDRSLKPW